MKNIDIKDLNDLNLSFNKFLTWFLDDRSSCLELDGDHRSYEIASHLSKNFQILSKNKITQIGIAEYHPRRFILENFKKIEDTAYERKIIDIYNYVNKNLSEYISHFIIHGSLANYDFSKGWSDVDTFVVIKNSTLLSPNKLNKFRSFCLEIKNLFYKICPLQHHGLIVFSENDLSNYSSYFIPHQILNSSIEFLDSAPYLKLNIGSNHKSFDELLTISRIESLKKDLEKAIVSGKLCHHPYKRECLENNFRNSENAMRQIFWLSGNIMTMPAYLLTSIGRPCEKKFSFKRTEKLYSKESLEIIAKVSLIREKWEHNEGTSYQGNSIPNWMKEILGKEYFERFNFLLDDTLKIIKEHQNNF